MLSIATNTKKIFKTVISIIVFFLLFLSFIAIYYSPMYLFIQLQNIFNDKLHINKSITIKLPKNWLYSIVGEENIQSNLYYLNKDFIKNNHIDIKSMLFTMENKDNKGIIKFQNKKYIDTVFNKYGEKYTTHDGKNCKYQVYQENNQIKYIYIPIKNARLSFKTYDKKVTRFVDELCSQ